MDRSDSLLPHVFRKLDNDNNSRFPGMLNSTLRSGSGFFNSTNSSTNSPNVSSPVGEDGNLTETGADDILPEDVLINKTNIGPPKEKKHDLVEEATNDAQKYGFLIVAVVVALLMLGVYRTYVGCRRRIEQREMQLINTQADNALDEMDTPGESDDEEGDEGELI